MAIYKRGREQIQQVARVGFEPETARLRVRRSDHLRAATQPPWRQNYNAVKKIKRLGREKAIQCLNFET